MFSSYVSVEHGFWQIFFVIFDYKKGNAVEQVWKFLVKARVQFLQKEYFQSFPQGPLAICQGEEKKIQKELRVVVQRGEDKIWQL